MEENVKFEISNLKKILEDYRITVRELGEYIGCSVQSVYRYINGIRTPSQEIQEKIERYINEVISHERLGRENLEKSLNAIEVLSEIGFHEFKERFGGLETKRQLEIIKNFDVMESISNEWIFFLTRTLVLYSDFPELITIVEENLLYLSRHRDVDNPILSKQEYNILAKLEDIAKSNNDDDTEISIHSIEEKFERWDDKSKYYSLQFLALYDLIDKKMLDHLRLFVFLGMGTKRKVSYKYQVRNPITTIKTGKKSITIDLSRLSLSYSQLEVVNFIESLLMVAYYKKER